MTKQYKQRTVEPAERRITVKEALWIRTLWQGLRIIVVTDILREDLAQQFALTGGVEINASHVGMGRPDPAGGRPNFAPVNYRRVEVAVRKAGAAGRHSAVARLTQ